ncbi:class I SAM-dependent methyltransferase [Acinetobacter bereziniae]|uniref:class I SAM-dependent methyltransferase n=1 Tax=Acinetobacter bereziniae TaxID=106648 RepID=UPI00124FE45C|nr:SAM-dependent methyltransferase [Acinetobacter bereziniae]MBJ9904857.1 SAM-dependent methyltransferase [Acinetobacter bereziniae]MBJ9951326.1 SAM-dependent methyltransferase [Acinetobacter bereziniae]MCU4320555.1 SAM-dependent methyltransferase [Acinetobacter bereziniae]MCU4599284.1 SAM-dependent methyltransferase [Acinetobacter bereziniae]MCV2445516.1 SAM-dependent methyltransferase [Acinetobacter bereziniae]
MSDVASLSVQEQQFFDSVQQAIDNQNLDRLILSQYKGELTDLEKMTFRVIQLQQESVLSCLYRYKTNDITKNYPLSDALSTIQQLAEQCKQANLFTDEAEIQLKKNKKKALLTVSKNKAGKSPKTEQQAHDRSKQRFVDQQSYFLQPLGITDANAQVIPSMARKWKQINKFIEIFSGALTQILPQELRDQTQSQEQPLKVVDFGSGKGYLTFALYDYLAKHHQTADVTGVELNDKMVKFCQDVAKASGFEQLDFFQGDVRTYHPSHLDVMIALHACDVATDFAIHTGIRLNAQMIMCAPCCHKELRPQLKSPQVLQPMLQFGIHAGQQAEMLTDTIRALLLKAYGYETKVFEFVALEHTSKNKMILATKRKDFVEPDPAVLAQIQALKTMYGIHKQSLELLLNNQWDQQDIGEKC